MSEHLLQLRDVTVTFDAGSGAPPRSVLRGVDLELAARESLAVVGPSGSGKSTLLNVIGALLPCTSGQVLLEGRDLATLDADQLAGVRNERIGFVFQEHHLLPQLDALENVLVPTLGRAGRSSSEDVDRARRLLEQVGLTERMHQRPARLSGGECQRVAVVRALINEPALLLADEPTGSLDAAAADQLADLLCSLNEAHGLALLVVTHSARLAARMQRVLTLEDGRLAAREPGTPSP